MKTRPSPVVLQTMVDRRTVMFSLVVFCIIIAGPVHMCDGLAVPKELFPCKPQAVKFNVSLRSSDTLVVLANSSYCKSPFQPFSGFRVHAKLETEDNTTVDSSKPIVFAARRANRGGLESWSVPLELQLNGTAIPRTNLSVSHTLCPVELNNELWPYVDDEIGGDDRPLPLFYIDVFTYSSKALFYSILVEPLYNFDISHINASKSQTATICPASPQVFYYKIPSDYEAVTVEVLSTRKAVGCAIVSVQNNSCPFNELLDNTMSKGMYQSMTDKALLTVESNWVQNREFLLVLVAANNSICHDRLNETDFSKFMADGQQVEIKIRKLKMIGSYTKAIIFPILLALIIAVVSTVALFFCWTVRYEPCCIPITCKKKRCPLCYHIGPCKCICIRGLSVEEASTENTVCSVHGPCVAVCFKRKDESVDDELCAPCGDDDSSNEDDRTLPNEGGIQQSSDRNQTASEATPLLQDTGKFCAQGKDQSANIKKHHLEYAWSAIIVGIFYALPSTQLLIFHQQFLHWSGNQDACYYNFMCTRPAFQLSAFNNVWSNMCYILLGLWFCVIVLIRQCCFYWKYKKSAEGRQQYIDTHGLHQHFGLFYAMGIGLMLEGLMGCLYHICPNNANFQFDTSFMYIIAGLAIVKLLHMRHSSISTNVFAVFFSFGVVIFFVVVGIYNDRHNSFAVRFTFGMLMLIIALPVIVVSFYGFKLYKSNIKIAVSQCCNIWKKICHRWYTLRLAIILLINIIACITFLTPKFYNGIASTVFALILMNALFLLLIYSITKVLHGEPLTFLAMILPVIIGLCCGYAFSFYGQVTEWSIPPAESRARNEECYLMDFYDKHDVWHMSIACGIFFIYIFILVLDDGVIDKERKKLKNF